MLCLKNKINNSNEQIKENISRFEVKLTKLSHSQPENDEANVDQSNENIVNTDRGEVYVPRAEVETEIENNNIPTNETSIQDHQVVKDTERRQVRPDPRYEINNLTGFALISSESLEYSEPPSYEEAMNSSDFEKWKEAMNEEMKSLFDDKTWKLVKKHETQRVVQCK